VAQFGPERWLSLVRNNHEVFGYTLLPIFGGQYDNKNMYPLDIYEHYELCGEIHLKIKDLPDGTAIQMKVIE